MAIYCNEQQLIERANKITILLSPLLPKGRRIAATRYPRGRQEFIIGAHQFKIEKSSSMPDFRLWYFNTTNDNFSGNYFEQWNLISSNNWIMKSAYLNFLYKEENILSLHCDPDEEIASAHYKYKRGPHLHITDKHGVFSDAHIALNLSNIDQVVNSLEDLETAFGNAVLMIKEQFIS